MSSKNGYISLDQLRAAKRLEADVEVDGFGKFRVQANTQEELRRTGLDTRLPNGETDYYLYRMELVAFALIEPPVANVAAENLPEALEIIGAMHPVVLAMLDVERTKLTTSEPSELFKSFTDAAGSREKTADTVSTSST